LRPSRNGVDCWRDSASEYPKELGFGAPDRFGVPRLAPLHNAHGGIKTIIAGQQLNGLANAELLPQLRNIIAGCVVADWFERSGFNPVAPISRD
jgi:hypothetical protein